MAPCRKLCRTLSGGLKLLFDSFSIQGFRAFPSLELPRLGRATLLIGRNIVGKTTVLEALRLYAAEGDIFVLQDILTNREEFDATRPAVDGDRRHLAYENLFYGRQPLGEAPTGLSLGPIRPSRARLSLDFVWFQEVIDDDGDLVRRLVPTKELSPTARPGLRISRGSARGPIRPLDTPLTRQGAITRTSAVARRRNLGAVFVSADRLSSSRIGQMWDAIALTDLEDEVIRALQLVVGEIERISLVSDRAHDRTAVVKLSNVAKPVPLRSLGDGTSRMLSIALSLVSASRGLLLVDEVENGIHFATQYDMWRLIFAVATRLDVQVVATTHSLDALHAFARAALESAEEGVAVRLERNDGEYRAVSFTEQEMQVAAEQGIELR